MFINHNNEPLLFFPPSAFCCNEALPQRRLSGQTPSQAAQRSRAVHICILKGLDGRGEHRRGDVSSEGFPSLPVPADRRRNGTLSRERPWGAGAG